MKEVRDLRDTCEELLRVSNGLGLDRQQVAWLKRMIKAFFNKAELEILEEDS